jgi:ABC-2 type transport system ATP-binding protein
VETCIKICNLDCYYGKKKALDSFSFEIEQGKCLGILGPNGAGKTTLIRNIMGVIPPNKGVVYTLGLDASDSFVEIGRLSGYLPEGSSVFMNMTLYEYLLFYAKLREVDNPGEAVDSVIEMIELTEEKNTKLKKFSKGMIQKAKIASVIVHNPKLLILDEPTDGLDISTTNTFVEYINGFVEDGLTVIICSHLPDVIDRVCTDILFIDKGTKLFEGSKEEFLKLGDGTVSSAYQAIYDKRGEKK